MAAAPPEPPDPAWCDHEGGCCPDCAFAEHVHLAIRAFHGAAADVAASPPAVREAVDMLFQALCRRYREELARGWRPVTAGAAGPAPRESPGLAQ